MGDLSVFLRSNEGYRFNVPSGDNIHKTAICPCPSCKQERTYWLRAPKVPTSGGYLKLSAINRVKRMPPIMTCMRDITFQDYLESVSSGSVTHNCLPHTRTEPALWGDQAALSH